MKEKKKLFRRWRAALSLSAEEIVFSSKISTSRLFPFCKLSHRRTALYSAQKILSYVSSLLFDAIFVKFAQFSDYAFVFISKFSILWAFYIAIPIILRYNNHANRAAVRLADGAFIGKPYHFLIPVRI